MQTTDVVDVLYLTILTVYLSSEVIIHKKNWVHIAADPVCLFISSCNWCLCSPDNRT